MGKTILKIGYITVALVLCILFGVLNYNTGADEAYIDALKQAVASEDSKDLASLFSSFSLPYDSKPYVENSTDNENKLSVYGGVNMLTLNYKETVDDKEETKTYKNVENFYYIFIKKVTYPNGDKIELDSTTNESGLRFYNEDGKYYDYHFVVSSKVNSDEYSTEIDSPTKALINSERNINTTFKKQGSEYDFIFANVGETLAKYIKEQLDGKNIVKFNLVDRDGKLVYDDMNVRFDFSQSYFKDIEEFKDSFNIYYNSTDKESEEYKNAITFLENFKVSSLNNENYQEGLSRDQIYNAKLVWRTIGIVSLFVITFAILYILFFHFKLIKRIVFRENKQRGRYVPNKTPGRYQPKASAPNKQNSIDAKIEKVEEVKDTKEENK